MSDKKDAKQRRLFPDLPPPSGGLQPPISDALLPPRKGRKWDQGKLKYDLILVGFLELMAEILTKGEINHPKEPDGTPSWQLVEPERYVNALFRHLQEYRKDPGSLDKEMGTHHMGHVAVNAMFLWWFGTRGDEK